MNTGFRLGTLLATITLLTLGTACPAEEDPPEQGSSSSGEQASSSGEDGSTGPGATSSDPSSDEGTSTGEDDSTGSSVEPGCECAAEVEVGFVELACDVEEICEPLVLLCDQEPLSECELGELVVENPMVLECHHDALAAGTAGMLRWELPYAPDPGTEGQRTVLVLDEGRRALAWHEAWAVPTYAISDVAVSELRPAEHFDGCMELPSPEEVFRCLYDAMETELAVCIPAHDFPIG